MTRIDLTEMRHSIDWADQRITSLEADLVRFNQGDRLTWTSAPYPNSRATMHFVKAAPSSTAFLTRDVAAIIEAQRNSLDHLVTALAEVCGATDPSDTAYPFANSEEAFKEKRIQKSIRHLTDQCKQIICDTKPYPGGNDALYAMHWLNKNAKHRRPLVLGQAPGLAGIHPVAGGRPAEIRRLLMCNVVDIERGEQPVLVVDMTGDATFSIKVQISFSNYLGAAGVPVLPTLREFSAICRSIFDQFDV